MQKCMWIVLIIALLALVLALFSLYQTMRFTKTTFQSIDSSGTLTGTQIVPKTDTGAKDPGIHWTTTEYSPVSEGEFWEKRGELSGKKIEVTAELDTDTMTLQPKLFPNPITLKKSDLIDPDKDTWIRNQGKQTVVIQGVFYLHLAMGEDGKRTESYSMVVDRMVQKLDANKYYLWPDKRTPTDAIDTRLFSSFDAETLKKLDSKPVTYVGVYTVEDSAGVLDGKLLVDLEKVTNTTLLEKLTQGNIQVRVSGVLYLNKEQSKYPAVLEAGNLEILDQK